MRFSKDNWPRLLTTHPHAFTSCKLPPFSHRQDPRYVRLRPTIDSSRLPERARDDAVVLCSGYMCTTVSCGFAFASVVLLGLVHQNLRLLRWADTREPAVRGTRTRARRLAFPVGPACRCNAWPFVRRAAGRGATASLYFCHIILFRVAHGVFSHPRGQRRGHAGRSSHMHLHHAHGGCGRGAAGAQVVRIILRGGVCELSGPIAVLVC